LGNNVPIEIDGRQQLTEHWPPR